MVNFIRNLSQKLRGEDEQDSVGQETIGEKKELLKLEMPDEDLIKLIDDDIKNSKDLYDAMRKLSQENEAYYLGEQLDSSLFFPYELKTAENLLYMATETKIAIKTAKRREPIVLAAQDTDESRQQAQKTQKFLTAKWVKDSLDIIIEDWVRHADI